MAEIPPKAVSLPDNWILPSPSTICTHLVCRLRQVTPATNDQAAAAAPSREGSLVPTNPPHHLVPFLSCPHAIPKPPPPSTAHIHLNSSLFYITPRNSRLPCPCNHTVDSMCHSKRVSHPGGNFDTVPILRRPQYTHHRLDLHPQIFRRLSHNSRSVPCLRRRGVLISGFNRRRQHLRRRVLAAFLTAVVVSLTIAHARQPSADLGNDGNDDDDGVREPGYGWPAAI